MPIRLDPSAYSSKFHNIIHSWDRYIISYGGRGSGKTDSFFLKYILSLFEPYYFRLAYVNKEKSNIRDQQYAGFKRVAERIGLADRLKFYDGDYRIVNLKNGNALIPKGVDDPEKTKGLDDITAIWWDEANKGEREDFTALNALLRSPMAKYLQFSISFNPVDESHWLRSTFFSPDDAHALHSDYKGQALLNRSTFRDNEFIDQEAYYKTLLINASGNPNRIRVDVEGDWGLVENENPWLYNLQDKNIGDAPFLPSFPIYISFDFNVNPFACTIWQMSPQKGLNNSFIHCIDEIVGKIKLEDLCHQIKTKYPASIKYVTGDRSGKNEDVGRNQTLYQIIASYLCISERNLELNNTNLEHSDSRELCNAMFYHYPNLRISSKCTNLIQDCQKATVDIESSKPSQLKKDRAGFKMDTFDSMRYFFQTYFHKFAKDTYFRVINKR